MKRTYARRPLRRQLDTGIRPVASTYGKRSFATFSEKAGGLVAPESQAERIVANLLTVDPDVSWFKSQPFKVDIVERRILRTSEDVAEARARHRYRDGDLFYTPDFEMRLGSGACEAIEVKLESFEGDDHYQLKLSEARGVLRDFGYQLRTVVMPANRTHPVYVNAQMLKQAGLRTDLTPPPRVFDALHDAHSAGAKTLHDYCQALGLPMQMMPILLVRGGLCAELLSTPINGFMAAEPPFGDLDHLHLLGGLEK